MQYTMYDESWSPQLVLETRLTGEFGPKDSELSDGHAYTSPAKITTFKPPCSSFTARCSANSDFPAVFSLFVYA